jgi:hypothetical protein
MWIFETDVDGSRDEFDVPSPPSPLRFVPLQDAFVSFPVFSPYYYFVVDINSSLNIHHDEVYPVPLCAIAMQRQCLSVHEEF